LAASAFDPENDRTMQLRAAGQASKNAGDVKAEKKIRRQLTDVAKFATRLGFSSPTEYEDWLVRGAPEDELPPECRTNPDAPIVDDDSSERLQRRTDAAIEKAQGVSTNTLTAERHRENRHDANRLPSSAAPPAPPPAPRPPSPWSAPSSLSDDDDYVDPFALARRSAPRRAPSGYFSGGP